MLNSDRIFTTVYGFQAETLHNPAVCCKPQLGSSLGAVGVPERESRLIVGKEVEHQKAVAVEVEPILVVRQADKQVVPQLRGLRGTQRLRFHYLRNETTGSLFRRLLGFKVTQVVREHVRLTGCVWLTPVTGRGASASTEGGLVATMDIIRDLAPAQHARASRRCPPRRLTVVTVPYFTGRMGNFYARRLSCGLESGVTGVERQQREDQNRAPNNNIRGVGWDLCAHCREVTPHRIQHDEGRYQNRHDDRPLGQRIQPPRSTAAIAAAPDSGIRSTAHPPIQPGMAPLVADTSSRTTSRIHNATVMIIAYEYDNPLPAASLSLSVAAVAMSVSHSRHASTSRLTKTPSHQTLWYVQRSLGGAPQPRGGSSLPC
jgi:hypothetical protein